MSVAPGAPLTRPQQHLYAAGHFGISLMGYVITQWVMKFYFPNHPGAANLLPALLAPWIMALGRVTDGINDPIFGYLSDSVRTRWGRRKPFMILGIPLVCASFMLLWYPPDRFASAHNFWYATVLLVFFFAAFTSFVGPYTALISEIASTEQERLKLSGLQGTYNVAGLIAGGFVTGLLLKVGLSFRAMAAVITAVSFIAYVMPLLGPRDDPARTAGQPRPAFFAALRMTFGNRPFRIYVAAQLLFLMGLLVLVAALPYIAETLLHRSEGEAGTLTGISLLAGLLCVPLILKLAARIGTPAAFQFSLRWFAVSAALLATLTLMGTRSDVGIWLARAIVVLPGIAVAGLFALPYTILAGITDHDRARTGMDRQGMLFCVQGMVLKIAYSGAPMLVVGLLVALPHSSRLVLTLMGPLAGALALAAHAVFRRFPIEEVERAVAARQAQEQPGP
jgi:GPH family glycoside/pentoside/hexuronide:cation symporter